MGVISDPQTGGLVTAHFRPSDDFQIVGQNRILLVGNWRIIFELQRDNFELIFTTVNGESDLFVDEDNPLLPPIEILDDELSGWTVDVSDWGELPGQAYVEAFVLENENAYRVGIEVTHGSPSRPYDDVFLRFERILPPSDKP